MRNMMLPYKMASKGCKALAAELSLKRIKNDENSQYESKDTDRVINWGTSYSRCVAPVRDLTDEQWINHPRAVENSVDKVATFNLLKQNGVPTLEHTGLMGVAQSWLADREAVVARNQVRGMKGKGISYITRLENLVEAPLYTKFFEHEAEIRVHFGFGNVIEIHDKTGAGFKGTHSGSPYVIHEPLVETIAAQAIAALGLDFGAVDILYRYNDGNPEAVVIEVNTAPQVDNGTLVAYTLAFAKHLNL